MLGSLPLSSGTLFGLPFDVAKKCITSHCNSVIMKGATRKVHQGVFKVEATKEEGAPSKDIVGTMKTLSVEGDKQAKRKRQ